MLDGVPPALRRRTGYGLDTCHLFSAGHDITASAAALAGDPRPVRGRRGIAARLLPPQRQRRRRSAPTGTATC